MESMQIIDLSDNIITCTKALNKIKWQKLETLRIGGNQINELNISRLMTSKSMKVLEMFV